MEQLTPGMAIIAILSWLLTEAVKKWTPIIATAINSILPEILRGNREAVKRFTGDVIKRFLPLIPSIVGFVAGYLVPGESCMSGLCVGAGMTVLHKARKQMFE
jgi:hypothetical protein